MIFGLVQYAKAGREGPFVYFQRAIWFIAFLAERFRGATTDRARASLGNAIMFEGTGFE